MHPCTHTHMPTCSHLYTYCKVRSFSTRIIYMNECNLFWVIFFWISGGCDFQDSPRMYDFFCCFQKITDSCVYWLVHTRLYVYMHSLDIALIHMCDMTHSYVWHSAFIFGTWVIRMCDIAHSYVWHDVFICETWLIHMWDRTYSYLGHDSFIRVIWLIHVRDTIHLHVWHDSFTCGTWLIHMCDMTHSHERHDNL